MIEVWCDNCGAITKHEKRRNSNNLYKCKVCGKEGRVYRRSRQGAADWDGYSNV